MTSLRRTFRFILIGSIAVLAFFLILAAHGQTVRLVWNPSPGAGGVVYRVFAGTNNPLTTPSWKPSGTWLGDSSTNKAIPLSELYAGTNYMVVAAAWTNSAGTNAIMSDFSNVVVIQRLPAPALRMEVSIFT